MSGRAILIINILILVIQDQAKLKAVIVPTILKITPITIKYVIVTPS